MQKLKLKTLELTSLSHKQTALISLTLTDMIHWSTRTPQKIGLKSLEWWLFSTFSKVSIGGLTSNSEFTILPNQLITIWLSLHPLCSLLQSCSFSELELTNKSSPTSSTLRKSLRRTKDKEMKERRSKTRKLKPPRPTCES